MMYLMQLEQSFFLPFLAYFQRLPADVMPVYIEITRFVMPLLALVLLVRCAWPMISFRRQPEIWGWLKMGDDRHVPLTHWENVIGRSKSCDVTLQLSTVSRSHAVLTRYDDGSWMVTNLSKNGTTVNGEKITFCAVHAGDTINIGGIRMQLLTATEKQEKMQQDLRSKAYSFLGTLMNVFLLSVIQVMFCLGFLLSENMLTELAALEGFCGIAACEWMLFLFYQVIRRNSFDMECLAFFLCSVGMAVVLSVCPNEAQKQLFALVFGVAAFLIIGWTLRELERAKRFRYPAAMAGFLFMAVTLAFGREYFGARNWVVIGGLSLQLPELTKVCFVYAGASTMDRIVQKRNLFSFIAYSILICGCLAVMNDFGTALIFFTAFLVIAYLRSGSVGTVALAVSALFLTALLAVQVAPHAMKRFAVWRHIWDDPFNAGYQQVHALMAIASGGLFGLGAGQGKLGRIFAADSDIVFATVSEEWGLLLAVIAVMCIAAYGCFAIRSSSVARSSFYSIGGCTAASIFLVQTMLNCLGTLDILPFTGVTFPFVSNGGSSMIGAWALLAFIKAADTRQNASFAVKNHRGGKNA